MLDAEVTIKFIVNNVCEDEDIEDGCFKELVMDKIDQEGLYEIFVESDEYQVSDIKIIR